MIIEPALRAWLDEMVGLCEPLAQGELPDKAPFNEFAERFLAQVGHLHRPGHPHPLLQAWAEYWTEQTPGSLSDAAMAIAFHRLALSRLGSVSSLYLDPAASEAWSPEDRRLAWRALCPPALANHLLSPPDSPRWNMDRTLYMTRSWWANAVRRTIALTQHITDQVPGWADHDQQQAWIRPLLDGVLPSPSASEYNQSLAAGLRQLLSLCDHTLLNDPCLPKWEQHWSVHGEVLAQWRDHQAQGLRPTDSSLLSTSRYRP